MPTMTESHSTSHSTTSGGQPYFADAEWETLRNDDRHAAKMVVGLMTSIFLIGVVLYLSVCWAVAS
jgi:hypothetical protein